MDLRQSKSDKSENEIKIVSQTCATNWPKKEPGESELVRLVRMDSRIKSNRFVRINLTALILESRLELIRRDSS